MLGRRALRLGLPLADLLARVAPARVAYPVADLIGRAWYRMAPARRALVGENLRRVCEATGRPTDAASLRRLVRRAFVEHARYYLELLRVSSYRPERIRDRVEVVDWEHWEGVLRSGVVIAIAHFGNFEPYGIYVAEERIAATAPVEEIKPRELFEFVHRRRGAGRISVVPLSRARRPMIEALRRGEVVALAADRDLGGDGIEVDLFGHRTTLPAGPSGLTIMTGRPLIVASCIRVGRDRFRARAWPVEIELSGDRHADAAALTAGIARRFEEAIGEAPEQWWGSFQPIWLDQRAERRS